MDRGNKREMFLKPGIFRREGVRHLHCGRDDILRTCRAASFVPRIVQEVSEIFTALNFVRAGAGVALVPRSSRVMRAPNIRYGEGRASGQVEDRPHVPQVVSRRPDPQPVLVPGTSRLQGADKTRGLAQETF